MVNIDVINLEKLIEDFFSTAEKESVEKAIKLLSLQILEISDEMDNSKLQEIEQFVNSVNDIEIYLENEFYARLGKEISEYKSLANILSNAGIASDILVSYTHSQDDSQREQLLYTAQRYYEMLINYLELAGLGESTYFKSIDVPDELFSYGELEIIRFCNKEEFTSRLIEEYSDYDLAEKLKTAHIFCNYDSEEVKEFFVNRFLKDDLKTEHILLTFNRIVTEGNNGLLEVADAFKDRLLGEPNVENESVIHVGIEFFKNGQNALIEMVNNTDDFVRQQACLHYLSESNVDKQLLFFAINYLIGLHDDNAEWSENTEVVAILALKIMLSARIDIIKKTLDDDSTLPSLINFLTHIDSPAVINHLCIFLRYDIPKTIGYIQKLIDDAPNYKSKRDIVNSSGIIDFVNSANYSIKEAVDTFYISQ